MPCTEACVHACVYMCFTELILIKGIFPVLGNLAGMGCRLALVCEVRISWRLQENEILTSSQ